MKLKEGRVGQRLRRLRKSLQTWKRRAAEKQALIRSLRVKLRDMEVSRALWKTRAVSKGSSSHFATSVEMGSSRDEMTAEQ
jgi:hypothetical protein